MQAFYKQNQVKPKISLKTDPYTLIEQSANYTNGNYLYIWNAKLYFTTPWFRLL